MLEIKVKRNEQAKKSTKEKKPSAWPWLIGLAGIGGLWYLNRRKKQKERVALAQGQATQLQAAQLAQQQTKTIPQRQSLPGNTAEARLAGMGINTGMPSQYQSGENYKER